MNEAVILLAEITAALPSLSKSECKVARAVLEDPEAATRSSIAVLAKAAGVSEPSVNRFCKRFGASGFPDFKLRLAQSLVSGVRYISQAVALDDTVETYPGKLFDNTIAALMLARDHLPLTALQQSIDTLALAKQIHFLGLGTSAAVAREAEHKFFRFRIPVTAHTDPLMHKMLAAGASNDEVFFFISHTGRTRMLVETARIARANNAMVISLTSDHSPLAQISDISIALNVAEDTDTYLPMTSRIIHSVLLDVLATGLTLKLGETIEPYLARIKDSLIDSRIPIKKR